MCDDLGMAEREVLSWLDFGTAVDDLARTVVSDGFWPEVVLGIARGGLLVSGGLSYALGVKNVHVVNIEYYTGVDERLEQMDRLPMVEQARAAARSKARHHLTLRHPSCVDGGAGRTGHHQRSPSRQSQIS